MHPCPVCSHQNPDAALLQRLRCRADERAGTGGAEDRSPVLFADLVGFTSRAEPLDPEDVRALLGAVLEASARASSSGAGDGREVHRRRRDGALRRAGRPRGRSRAGGAGGARDPGLGARRGRPAGADRREHRRGARAARRAPGRGRGDGRGRRRQHRGAPAGRGAGERHPRRRDDLPRDARAIDYAEREPVAAKGKAEPVPVWEAVEARSRFGGDVERGRCCRWSGARRELDTMLARARRAHARALAAARDAHRRPGNRQVAARRGALRDSCAASPSSSYWRQGRCASRTARASASGRSARW